MKIFDLHCDTVMKLIMNKDSKLSTNNFHVDIKKLKKGESLAQFFAVFLYKEAELSKYGYNTLYELSMDMIDRFFIEIEKNNEDIAFAKNIDDLNKNKKCDKISAFLSIEEGGVIGEDFYKLRNYYRLGVRLITLTWNFPNSIGFPNSKKEYMDKGLTKFGKKLIEYMNELGIIIDVSHLSDGGFFDVSEISEKPFVASHSNARSIQNHFRNLTDEMIEIISNSGGIIGLNFSSNFLAGGKESKISDMIKHLKHIINIGGIDVAAIGSDFDGIRSELEIDNFGSMQKLVRELEKNDFSLNEIEKICYKNAERVIRDIIK